MQQSIRVLLILLSLSMMGCSAHAERKSFVVTNYESSVQEQVKINDRPRERSQLEEGVYTWLSDSIRFNEFDPCDKLYLSSEEWINLSKEYTHDEFKLYFLNHADKTLRHEFDLKEFLTFYGLIKKVEEDGRLRIPLLKSYQQTMPEQVQDLYTVSDLLLSCRRLPQFSSCMKEFDCYIDLYFDPGTTDLRRMDIGKV